MKRLLEMSIFLSPVATPRAPLTTEWNLDSFWGSEAYCIKTHFWQIHLERAQYISIKQNKYCIVIEASKVSILQLLNCYGNL